MNWMMITTQKVRMTMARRSLKKMMATVTNPSFGDKMVLVVAVIGMATAVLTMRNVPTPEEHLAQMKGVLEDLTTLQAITNVAIDKGDYTSACLTQQRSTDLALQNNVHELGIDIDNLIRLEELICDEANKNLF